MSLVQPPDRATGVMTPAAVLGRPTPSAEAHQAFLAVVDHNPDLHLYGFRHRSFWPFPDNRDFAQWVWSFELCCSWIEACQAIIPARLDQGDCSYSLKHAVEKWAKTLGTSLHVWNGVFLASAVHVGLPLRRQGYDSPNADIGLSAKRISRARDRWDTLREKRPPPPYTRYDQVDRTLDAALGLSAESFSAGVRREP